MIVISHDRRTCYKAPLHFLREHNGVGCQSKVLVLSTEACTEMKRCWDLVSETCWRTVAGLLPWSFLDYLLKTSRTASPKAHTNVGSEGCREEQQPPKIRHLRQRLRSIRPWVQFVHQLLRLELLGCCAISCRGMLGIWMIKMVPENLGKVNRSTYK